MNECREQRREGDGQKRKKVEWDGAWMKRDFESDYRKGELEKVFSSENVGDILLAAATTQTRPSIPILNPY